MSFYATGFYTEQNEAGYYIFNSVTKQTVKIANKYLKNNTKIIKDIKNARLVKSAKGVDKQILRRKNSMSEFHPALITNGVITRNMETIIYIDFNAKTYGTVNYNGTTANWHPLSDLFKIKTGNSFNNLAYTKKTGQLHLNSYHVLGLKNQFDIVIKELIREEAYEDETEQEIEKNTIEEGDIYVSFDSITLIPNNIKGEELAKQLELYTNSENEGQEVLDKLIIENKSETAEKISLTQREFYRALLMTLKDDDIITVPKWVIRELKFKLKYNIDKSADVTRRVSLGTIALHEHSDKIVIAIIRFEDTLDNVKLQVMMGYNNDGKKNYSLEALKEQYLKWRANKRFVSI